MSKAPAERKSDTIKLRLTPDLAKRAREMSAKQGSSVSAITRHALITVFCEHGEMVLADIRKRRANAARQLVEAFAEVDANALRKALKAAGRNDL